MSWTENISTVAVVTFHSGADTWTLITQVKVFRMDNPLSRLSWTRLTVSTRVVPRNYSLVPFLGWGFLCFLKEGGVIMKEQLEAIQAEALEHVKQANDLKELQNIKVTYLGDRKSVV